ncbi:MAG: hypothetical protein R8P61_21840 [Bacteroidia bacterium]|nr:hypothetical protein [Bacteroidia bacterium]
MKKILFLVIFLPAIVYGQDPAEMLEQYESSHHLEKVYVSHDKPLYVPGDHIWGKAYVLDGRSHVWFDATPILYVDWIGPDKQILKTLSLQIKEGAASFDLKTGKDDPSGVYLLRAYTRYQKNFDPAYVFQKEIYLWDGDSLITDSLKAEASDFDLAFYPEGGNLVDDLLTKVAFKVQNDLGENIYAEGILKDNKGEVYSLIKTLHEGIGVFEVRPEQGKKYALEVKVGDQVKNFPLSQSLEKGMSLAVDNLDPEFIRIKLQSTLDGGLKGGSLLAHVRGQLFFSQSFQEGRQKELLLKKSEIPSGVLHFSLFDQENRSHCERLIFNRNPGEQIKVQLEVIKDEFAKREKAQLRVSSTSAGEIKPSQLSLSVYDLSYQKSLKDGLDIESYLLLQSDLKGRIQNIGQYFKDHDLRSQLLLDHLMMTHGWRRFSWTSVLAGESPDLVFPTEEKISIVGKITQHNSDKVLKADVFFNILSGDQFAALNLTTEEDGVFYFSGFDFTDTTSILLQANEFNSKKKERKLKKGEARRIGNKNVDISLMKFHEMDLVEEISLKNSPVLQSSEGEVSELKEEIEEINNLDSLFNATYNLTLEAVEIEGRRNLYQKRRQELKDLYKQRGMFMLSSTPKVYLDDFPKEGQIYRDFYGVMQSIVPGVRVEKIGSEVKVYLGRSTGLTGEALPALIVLDGAPISDARAAMIQANQILVIDRLQGIQATALWGIQGAGGVIIVTSRDPDKQRNLMAAETRIKGVMNLEHPGFYQAREFYAPNYDIEKEGPDLPDLRTTLYWNPDIRIKDEAASLDFFVGDRAQEFLIWVEGISEEGIPFIGGKVIRVEE